MSIKVGCKHHDMRIAGRIVGVHSTEQSVGIKVGGFCPPTYEQAHVVSDLLTLTSYYFVEVLK